MKTKFLLAAVAVAFSFALISCGNKKAADANAAAGDSICVAQTEQACNSAQTCDKAACDKKECCKAACDSTKCGKACDKACDKAACDKKKACDKAAGDKKCDKACDKK